MKRPDVFKSEVAPDLSDQLASTFASIQEQGIPMFFQCFDGDFVREIAPKTEAPVVLLVDGVFDPEEQWFEIGANLSDYYDVADGFGLYKALLFDKDLFPSGVVEQLHQAEKVIHVWTVRSDSLPNGIATPEQELKLLLSTGIDGLFTDFPGTAVEVRDSLRN